MLRIENLHAEVDGKAILNGLSLSVNAGEVHAIMGPNGAGKSTLASSPIRGGGTRSVTEGGVRGHEGPPPPPAVVPLPVPGRNR